MVCALMVALSVDQFLCAATVGALRKPGSGLTPVMVVDVFRRLVRKVLMSTPPVHACARGLAPSRCGAALKMHVK